MTEYVGFDVSKEETAYCIKDAAGRILARGKVATGPAALFGVIAAHCGAVGRVVMETGTLSSWLARELGALGLAVEVIDAREAHSVSRLQRNKTDAGDAERLSEAEAQARLLMTAPGVGPVTAQAFLAVIDDPGRFASSRAVGAYVGLTTRRWQSGEMDWSGRISKRGDAMLRSLLYEAANSLLTRHRAAHPLKDWARRLRKRSSHKKACVALARRLAVILHRMLVTGEPFRWPQEQAAAEA